MNRPKWQAIGILLAVFALGAVTGGGALAAWQGKQRQKSAAFLLGPRTDRPIMAMMRRLDLTREQQQAIEDVLEKHAPKRRAIMRDVVGRCGQDLDNEKAALDGEIRAVLNPAQRARFDELSQRQRERIFGHVGQRPGREQ